MEGGPGWSLCRGLGFGGPKYLPEPLLDEIVEVAAAPRRAPSAFARRYSSSGSSTVVLIAIAGHIYAVATSVRSIA